jgi:hypothetical protein
VHGTSAQSRCKMKHSVSGYYFFLFLKKINYFIRGIFGFLLAHANWLLEIVNLERWWSYQRWLSAHASLRTKWFSLQHLCWLKCRWLWLPSLCVTVVFLMIYSLDYIKVFWTTYLCESLLPRFCIHPSVLSAVYHCKKAEMYPWRPKILGPLGEIVGWVQENPVGGRVQLIWILFFCFAIPSWSFVSAIPFGMT